MMPTGYDVAAFLGQCENTGTVVLAEEHRVAAASTLSSVRVGPGESGVRSTGFS